MKTLVLCFIATVASAQVAGLVRQGFYDSSGNYKYECSAPQIMQTSTGFSVAASTLTSVSVSTNVGTVNFAATFYGWVGMTLKISGSATAALNGTYVVSAVSGSTATITTSGVSDATYNDSTLVVSTFNPLLNQSVWGIVIQYYNTANQWVGSKQAISSNSTSLACSNRASY